MDLVIINQPQVYPYRRPYHFAKRLIDVVMSILVLPFALPIIVICSVAVILDSAGPAFFIQERIGKDGKVFKMIKFRTMEHKLDDKHHRDFMKAFVNGCLGKSQDTTCEEGNEHEAEDDAYEMTFRKAFLNGLVDDNVQPAEETVYKPATSSQITRVGKILRKTSLDELPQIINILKGEMSWVGPRPNVPWEVEEYKPWHHERLEVLPGITGLAQVKGRSAIGFDTIVRYDIEYVEKQNLVLDFKILLQTLTTIFSGSGVK